MQLHRRETLSTAGLPAKQRLNQWIEFGSQTLSEMRVCPADRDTFEASLSRVEMGDIGFCWMSTTAATAQSDSNSIGSWAAPLKDSVLLIVQQRGRCWMDHNSWQGELGPGDMVFRSSSSPWRTKVLEPAGLIFIKLPLARILATIGDFDHLRSEPIRSSDCRGGLAATVILSVQKALASEIETPAPDELSELILESVKLTCAGAEAGKGPSSDFGYRRRLRRDVSWFIDRNLSDPNLSAAMIATTFSVHVRTLQRLFAELGQTPSQYILSRRLDRAAQILRIPGRSKSQNITEVAYSVGFNELSYFSRAFARRFHMPPGAYQKSVAS